VTLTIGGVPVSDIVDRGPLNAITGYDIGSRIGLNDLWGRDSKETKTSRESAIAFMLDHFGGPTASLLGLVLPTPMMLTHLAIIRRCWRRCSLLPLETLWLLTNTQMKV
jgi:hypothetical protein